MFLTSMRTKALNIENDLRSKVASSRFGRNFHFNSYWIIVSRNMFQLNWVLDISFSNRFENERFNIDEQNS